MRNGKVAVILQYVATQQVLIKFHFPFFEAFPAKKGTGNKRKKFDKRHANANDDNDDG